MKFVLRYIKTLRHLKWQQIFYRIYYRFFTPKPYSKSTPILRNSIGLWKSPQYHQSSTTDGIIFNFLNYKSKFYNNNNDDDANANALSKLWRYNFHYQNDLNSSLSDSQFSICHKLVTEWVLDNKDITGEGWEPYCISLRTVNWIKWISRLEKDQIDDRWLHSLASQIHILDQTIEYHILGNHIFSNAKALIFAGVFFGGEQGDHWLAKGIKIFQNCLTEQFLSDGAYFELSPMYHAIIMWDLADIIYLYKVSNLDELTHLSELSIKLFIKGQSWLKDIIHPDNDLSFFNDTALGIAPTINNFAEYSKMIGIEIPTNVKGKPLEGKLHSESGFGIIQWNDEHKIIADVGKIGPDHQPGHGHADTLSCELSLFGQRVLVNSGISTYNNNSNRYYERSTSAHNTIELNGENSSDVWASFRVAHRARPFDVKLLEEGHQFILCGSHDGYNRFLKRNIHSRRWLANDHYLIIHDKIRGSFKKATAYWHFHPNVIINQLEKYSFSLKLMKGQVITFKIEGAKPKLIKSFWNAEFGLSIPNQTLCLDIIASELTTHIEWKMN